jgi:hypothetical protein
MSVGLSIGDHPAPTIASAVIHRSADMFERSQAQTIVNYGRSTVCRDSLNIFRFIRWLLVKKIDLKCFIILFIAIVVSCGNPAADCENSTPTSFINVYFVRLRLCIRRGNWKWLTITWLLHGAVRQAMLRLHYVALKQVEFVFFDCTATCQNF